MGSTSWYSRFAKAASRFCGRPRVFTFAVAIILVWATTGPIFHFSDTWQLVINTSTTIVTFLMVFLIQNTQNRDGRAIQTKLDELILTSKAENEFIGIEKLTDKELEALQAQCLKRAEQHAQFHERVKAEAAARSAKRRVAGGRAKAAGRRAA